MSQSNSKHVVVRDLGSGTVVHELDVDAEAGMEEINLALVLSFSGYDPENQGITVEHPE